MSVSDQVTKCRRCGAPIFWALSKNEKVIPIDAQPVPDGNVVISEIGGKEYATVGSTLGLFNRYKSHFATCPFADEFRKGR